MVPSTHSKGLLRQIGLLSATALVFSNMIGTGIFTTTGRTLTRAAGLNWQKFVVISNTHPD